ncbi:MAG: TlpA family protein disulfide reductase [Flavobacteriales bacterium]|nr:TlpA family protein disulfide reductase [Flavobacteriales bacterium]
MKRILIIAAFLLVNTAWAQQFHFTGTISGLANEKLVAQFPKDFFDGSWQEEIPVENASFSKTVTIPASGWMTLSYKGKDRSVFAWKYADSLNIEFEADFLEDDKTVKFSGDGGNIHAFASQIKEKFGSKLTMEWLDGQAKDATNIDAMEMESFRLRNDVISAMEKFDPKLPEAFSKAYKNHIGYYYFLSLFKFSEAKTAGSSIPKATEVPKVLIEGLNWERMNKSSELDSRFFRELLLQFVDYKALEAYDFMKFADKQAQVQEAFNVARENLKGEALQYFLTQTLLANSIYVQPSLLRQMRDQLAGTSGSEVFVKLVEDSLAERLKAKDDEVEIAVNDIKSTHDEVDVELQGINGKTFKLSELKGKVVYLDIWASWCGPCRKEFPFSKALKEKLSKKELKEIEFLYISIDNTETVWKLAIEELGIEGVHGLSKGGWGSEVTAKFGVHSIPRYLIFDKKGKVVDPNAPRPSDPRLLEILQKLAGQ